MTNHSGLDEQIASEVRAALAKHRKTAADLARVCGISAHTAGRRLNGASPFSIVELFTIAEWLGTDMQSFIPTTDQAAS